MGSDASAHTYTHEPRVKVEVGLINRKDKREQAGCRWLKDIMYIHENGILKPIMYS